MLMPFHVAKHEYDLTGVETAAILTTLWLSNVLARLVIARGKFGRHSAQKMNCAILVGILCHQHELVLRGVNQRNLLDSSSFWGCLGMLAGNVHKRCD